MKDIPRARCAH